MYTCSQNQQKKNIQIHVPSEESVKVKTAVAVVAEVLKPLCPGVVATAAVCKPLVPGAEVMEHIHVHVLQCSTIMYVHKKVPTLRVEVHASQPD